MLPLAPWEAALGASVAIDMPGGEAKVRVPPGTSSGRRLRLRGRGLPHPKGRPGDLYAEARIMIPAKLTDAERGRRPDGSVPRSAAVSYGEPAQAGRRAGVSWDRHADVWSAPSGLRVLVHSVPRRRRVAEQGCPQPCQPAAEQPRHVHLRDAELGGDLRLRQVAVEPHDDQALDLWR